MKKSSLWYLLFVTAIAVGSVVLLRDFSIVMMLISFRVGDLVYLKLDKAHWRKWLVPSSIALALALSSFYYLVDLVIFPSTSRADRVHDAFLIGPIWAGAGLLAAFWAPGNKRKPVTASS